MKLSLSWNIIGNLQEEKDLNHLVPEEIEKDIVK